MSRYIVNKLYLEKPKRLKIWNGREYFTLPILNLRGIFPAVMRLSCDAKLLAKLEINNSTKGPVLVKKFGFTQKLSFSLSFLRMCCFSLQIAS
jgi:hypothetical protein